MKLNWETTSEVNFSRYEVQYSRPNLGDWTAIGTVPSTTANALNNDYSFTHANPAKGVNLYRLKMIDLDGKYTYSSVCQVSFDGNSGVVIYPNTPSDHINIQTDNPGAVSMVQLSDMNGRTLRSATLQANDNRIDIKTIAPSIYILTIFYQDGTKESHKVSIKIP